MTENGIGWMVTQDVRMNGKDEERNFGFSEWGPEAALEMCDKSRHLPCLYGGNFGDLIDTRIRSPRSCSKIRYYTKEARILDVYLNALCATWQETPPYVE